MHDQAELSVRLDQYALTAKGQMAQGHSIARIAGYAAAAGASLAMAGTAEASIVYSGVQNLMVSIDPAAQATTNIFRNSSSALVDMDGGGADLNLNVFAGSFAADFGGFSIAKYVGIGSLGASGGAALLGSGSYGASNLASGALIGPAESFGASNAGNAYKKFLVGGNTLVSTNVGNFNFDTTGFVGIRLGSGNFGWIRLRVDDLGRNRLFSTLLGGTPVDAGLNYPDKVTVVDWAYQNNGGSIRAGAIPEPAPLALLAAGAMGIGAFRRRKAAQAKAN